MRSLLSRLDRSLAPAPNLARVGWLREWTYAHRGLHGGAAGVVENSPAAFRAALTAGLGIECDIQRSRDGWAMVYHDWDFRRLHGVAGAGADLDGGEWQALRYAGSTEGPCTLAALLDMVAGRVPLLIEVKSRRDHDVEPTCWAVRAALAGYGGRHAVMSFDPRVPRWFRRNAPATVRGLVMRQDRHPDARAGIARQVALWIARPDFIAWDVRALPHPFTAALRRRGMPVLTWTVNTPRRRASALAHADAPIAEGAGLPPETHAGGSAP